MIRDANPAERRRALVVEDDSDLQRLMQMVLSNAGFEVMVAESGQEGLAIARAFNPDVVTLDLNLPDTDGLILCRGLRSATNAYIVILTARHDPQQVVLGLESGADDYMTKPFSTLELTARVNAVMRRPRELQYASVQTSTSSVTHGPLVMRLRERSSTLGSVDLALTRIEFDLLAALAERPEELVTRTDLLGAVWGEAWGDRHLVDVHIANLRRKLLEAHGGVAILTVRGLGYRLHQGTAPPSRIVKPRSQALPIS